MSEPNAPAVSETPEPLTFKMIKDASRDDMAKWMKTRRVELDAVLLAETQRVQDRLSAQGDAYQAEQDAKAERQAALEAEALEAAKSPEQKAEEAAEAEAEAAAKAAEDAATAEKAAADAAAADLAEKQRLAEEVVTAAPDVPKQKIVLDYQATDDDGQPIGRRTHLEGETYEEVLEKMKESHVNAVRYAERMKKRAIHKPEVKQPETPIVTLDEPALLKIKEDLDSKDELVVARAKIKLDLNEAAKAKKEAQDQLYANQGAAVSLEFLRRHPEYFNCDANKQIIGDYFQKNNLEWTLENLEDAFVATESQLAQRQSAAPAPAVPVAVEIKPEPVAANPPAAPAPVAAPAPAPVAAPEASTPVETTPAAPNAPVVASKPPVAGGVEPGTLHGARPAVSTKPVGYTKKQIKDMPKEEYRRRMKDPGFARMVTTLFKDGW